MSEPPADEADASAFVKPPKEPEVPQTVNPQSPLGQALQRRKREETEGGVLYAKHDSSIAE